MKFKAMVSDAGRSLLERQYLPCLEKHGKACRALLSPTELHLVQTEEEAERMLISLRLTLGTVFEPGSWRVQSRHANLIGFKFQVDHLRGVLRAASNSEAEIVELRLTTRAAGRQPGASGAGSQAKPVLCLTSKGPNSNMTHDIPLARVFQPEEIDELVGLADVSDLCPFYCDVWGEHHRLQGLADKLKGMGGELQLVATRHGCLHMQVAGPGVQLAAELQGLEVVPTAMRAQAPLQQAGSPEVRLQAALRAGLGQEAAVQLRQFAVCLHSSQAADPAKLLLGIAEGGGHVHFMFVFPAPDGEAGFNPDITLSYKLPVRGE